MTEKEILEKIVESAEDLKIPDQINKEAVKDRLKQRRRKQYGKIIASVLVLMIGVVGTIQGVRIGTERNDTAMIGETYTQQASSATDAAAEETATEDTTTKVRAPKRDVKDVYVIADNYEAVYDLLSETQNQAAEELRCYEADDVTYVDGSDDSTTTSSVADLEKNISFSESTKGSVQESANTDEAAHFSKTNLQTEGVDESDIVKTDGSYIYTVSKNKVIITDIRSGELKQIGEIGLSLKSAADQILEMYVDGESLSVIVQTEATDLTTDKTSGQTDAAKEDVYYFSSNRQTKVDTYDISNPKNPVLSGSVSQDGYYQTSRKIGDILYLFTNKEIYAPALTKEEAVTEENIGGWIPLINGKAVSADCIYLAETGNQGIVISSLDVNNPGEVVDNTVILNNYVDIYVSTDAIYLYQQSYSYQDPSTRIAKFRMDDGIIDAVGAATVVGRIMDIFAINEYQGKLRLLTTSGNTFGGETENNLYLFDEELNLTGKIEGMAAGEEIYAARYFKNMAYFVTYRNTDPLFAVDLSDSSNPKVLGELKITGFSEYLHFWGEDKLVGIGYETDPDSGERKGIKVTMFDISNPADLKEIKSLVLKDVDYCLALYEYKCALADAEENLLGFSVESYGDMDEIDYVLFSWEGGTFRNLLTEDLEYDLSGNSYRGIYVGDVFYIVSRKGISSYDREDNYRMLKRLEFAL